jgi:hypothetical protein
MVDYPFDWEIASFDPDARVVVSSTSDGAAPKKHFTIAYTATDFQGNKGIYTSRLNIFLNPVDQSVVSVGVEAPLRVGKVGDTIAGFGTFSDLGLSDSMNSSGQVAFWAKAGGTQGILVATPQSYADVIRKLKRFDPDSPLAEYVVPAAGDPNSAGNRTYKPRLGEPITQIVMHATDGNESSAVKSTLGVLAGANSVSAHYLVSREGRVTQIVGEDYRAFHAADPRQPSNLDGKTMAQ